MKTKVIVVEIRPSSKKKEKGLYGLTESEDGVARVFLNSRQSQGELINTFFHEMAHVYMHWQNDPSISVEQEEAVARIVGNVAEPCFRRYKGGRTKEFKKTG